MASPTMQLGFMRDPTTGALATTGSDTESLLLQAQGLQAQPFDLAASPVAQTILTSGRLEAALNPVQAGQQLNGVVIGLNAVTAGLTALYVAAFTAAGALLTTGTLLNQPTALDAATPGNLIALPFYASGQQAVTNSGAAYAAILAVGTTPPTIQRGNTQNTTNGVNGGVNRFVAVTGQSVMPATLGSAFKEVLPYYIAFY